MLGGPKFGDLQDLLETHPLNTTHTNTTTGHDDTNDPFVEFLEGDTVTLFFSFDIYSSQFKRRLTNTCRHTTRLKTASTTTTQQWEIYWKYLDQQFGIVVA